MCRVLGLLAPILISSSVMVARGVLELGSSSTSARVAESEAQNGQPVGVGVGQTLQERYARGVINARPTAQRAAAQAQQTGREKRKRKRVKSELVDELRGAGRTNANGENIIEGIWEQTIERLKDTQDKAALTEWYRRVQQMASSRVPLGAAV